jgi:hypothetical protein
MDADFGPRPCNCPRKFIPNRVYSFGGNDSCCPAGAVYKIRCCASANCLCVYIENSQRYVKKRVQEHICEVTKLYSTLILPTYYCQTIAPLSQTQTNTDSMNASVSSSTITQNSSILLLTYPPRCIISNVPTSNSPPRVLQMNLHPQTWLSNMSASVVNILTAQSLMSVKDDSSTAQPPSPQPPAPADS